jgi:uncharacterized membrane protein (DUF4010 family)
MGIRTVAAVMTNSPHGYAANQWLIMATMPAMPAYDTAALRLFIAILIGCLIGLDRERAQVRKHRELFAGIRTFALIALTGAVPAMMYGAWGPLPLVGSLLAVAALTLAAYLRSSAHGAIGTTTEFAALTTWLLGALAGNGQLLLAGGVAIAVAALLTAKLYLERLSRALNETEVRAAIELGMVSCIVLPLLPDRGYGPWLALNPFEIWLVVVIVLALSFIALITMRILGSQRGLLVTALIGGMASSTAVTIAMAQRSRETPDDTRIATQAAVLASAVMGVRVLLFAGVWGAGVLPRLLPAIAALIGISLACVMFLHRNTSATAAPTSSAVEMPNPFRLLAAASFALIYALVLLVFAGANTWLGLHGRVTAASISSLADVDAVTIALARGGPAPDDWRTTALAISMGVVANTLSKGVLVAIVGRGEFRRHLLWSLGLMTLGCSITALLVYL